MAYATGLLILATRQLVLPQFRPVYCLEQGKKISGTDNFIASKKLYRNGNLSNTFAVILITMYRKMKLTVPLLLSASLIVNNTSGQNINAETIEVRMMQAPKISLSPEQRNYKVTVTSPYNLTKEDIIKQSKADYQKTLADYDKTVAESEKDYQKKLKDHDEEEKKAKEKYEIESKKNLCWNDWP
jgi:hypothetical protein